MNEEERKEQEAIRRVGMNLGVLLDIGLFPGQHALGLQECKGLVKSVVDGAVAKLNSLTPPPVAPPAPAASTLTPPPLAVA